MDEQKPNPDSGIYKTAFTPQETAALLNQTTAGQFDDELAAVRVTIYRTLCKMNNQLQPLEFARLAWIVFHGARTIAYLSRTRHTISENGTNDFFASISRATKELAAERGWKL